jgi:hypothetical protein
VINSPVSAGGLVASTPISFGLSLSAPPVVHYIPAATTPPTGCSGSVTNPGASSGNLCIFEQQSANGSASEFDPVSGSANTAQPFGAAIRVVSAGAGAFNTTGTWAVTG